MIIIGTPYYMSPEATRAPPLRTPLGEGGSAPQGGIFVSEKTQYYNRSAIATTVLDGEGEVPLRGSAPKGRISE